MVVGAVLGRQPAHAGHVQLLLPLAHPAQGGDGVGLAVASGSGLWGSAVVCREEAKEVTPCTMHRNTNVQYNTVHCMLPSDISACSACTCTYMHMYM